MLQYILSMPSADWHRLEIFGSAWLEPIDSRRASITSMLPIAVQ
jgi:hypothetical protein